MHDSWHKVRMQELCEITSSKRIYASDYVSEGIPFYRGKEIIEKQQGSTVSTELFITESKFTEVTQKYGMPEAGDLLLTSVGTLGIPYVVKKDDSFYFKDGNLTWFRNFKQEIYSRFLYYWILSPNGKAELKKATIGSSQPAFTIVLLKDMEINLPPLNSQHKIASILSAYDDLIENNNRRIRILEEMAQAIYRDWFVNFRFPMHEKVKMVKSELGMIPEGWEVRKATECVDINPRTRVDKDKSKPYVDMGGLSETSMIIQCKGHRTGSNGSKFMNGDTLFARITPCLENGKTGFVQFLDGVAEGIGSTEFIVMRSKALSSEFVYLLARSEDFRNNAIKSMTGASGRQRVQPECFDKYLLAQPHQSVLVKFTEIVKPMFQNIHRLDFKNKNLRKTRDLLLPKLISGEIDVEEMEIKVPEEVEA